MFPEGFFIIIAKLSCRIGCRKSTTREPSAEIENGPKPMSISCKYVFKLKTWEESWVSREVYRNLIRCSMNMFSKCLADEALFPAWPPWVNRWIHKKIFFLVPYPRICLLSNKTVTRLDCLVYSVLIHVSKICNLIVLIYYHFSQLHHLSLSWLICVNW